MAFIIVYILLVIAFHIAEYFFKLGKRKGEEVRELSLHDRVKHFAPEIDLMEHGELIPEPAYKCREFMLNRAKIKAYESKDGWEYIEYEETKTEPKKPVYLEIE